MPFNVSVQNLGSNSRRFAVSPNQAGGYNRSERPNPNSGMATFQRNQQPATQPTQGPILPPSVASTDPLGVGLQQRGMAARAEADQAQATDSAALGVALPTNVLADPKWQGLLQALFEAGGNHVMARGSGWGTPGFFAQQDPHHLQRRALAEQLASQDINQYGRTR